MFGNPTLTQPYFLSVCKSLTLQPSQRRRASAVLDRNSRFNIRIVIQTLIEDVLGWLNTYSNMKTVFCGIFIIFNVYGQDFENFVSSVEFIST